MKISLTILLKGTALCLLMSAFSCTGHDHSGVYEEIRSADRMVFASMAITKTARTESSDWYKIGKRIAVYSYDSYMKAYIDLSALTPDDIVFDDDNKTVRLTLPPVETEIAGRDMEMKKVYENIGLFRSDLDSKERAEMKEKANSSFRREVRENPDFRRRLIDSAKRKARLYFETLLAARGYKATVDFKQSVL